MEPISTMIATAIALGAAEGLKPTVKEAIQDAYAGFKRVIQDRYAENEDVSDAIDYVEKKPVAEKRRSMLESALEEAGAEEDSELAEAARHLVDTVRKEDPAVVESIGMDIEELESATLNVDKVLAGKGGTAVRIKRAKIEGAANFSNIGGGESDPG